MLSSTERSDRNNRETEPVLLTMLTDQQKYGESSNNLNLCELDDVVSLVQAVSVHIRLSEVKGHNDQCL